MPNITTIQENIMGADLNLLNKRINIEDVYPEGLFDPRCCILYLRNLPKAGKYDPNSTLMQMATRLKLDKKGTDNLKNKLQNDFNDLLDKLPKELVDEWKKNQGVSKDYIYDPAKEFTFTTPPFQHSQLLITKAGTHTFTHEYCHYLQFLRTVASPMLIWAYLNLIQKALILFQLAKQNGQSCIQFPIKVDNNSHKALISILDDPALEGILNWHYSRPNYLKAIDIREAEAEFNSLLYGKQFLRFRYFRISEHPVTIHFRELNKINPEYARAYLETESALGDWAPSLFPLITHFALSMPFKKYSRFNIEDFEPIHPEEAFNAAIDLLKKDLSFGRAYAVYAQQLYKKTRSIRPSRVLEQFSKKVCKINGWIYPSSRNLLKKWIGRVPTNSAFTQGLHKVFDDALKLQNKYGEEIFSDPFTKNHEPMLRTISLPPIVFPDEQQIKSVADSFWPKDFAQSAADIRIFMGFSLSIFTKLNIENQCPHRKCSFRELNLCHSVLAYPRLSNECGFPNLIKGFSGFLLSQFTKITE